MARPRSIYTPEFKLRAVKMITDQRLSVAEAARQRDVGENLLREWRKTFLSRGDAAFPGHGNPTPADDELRRLRAEVTRLKAERNARGHECSENTVAKLKKARGLRARSPRRFVRTTDSNHRLPVAANLLNRGFEPSKPNAAWSADITCIPTREGWVYLAVVEDLFSRRIVGWSMAETMESRLVVDAVEAAVACRRPGAGLIAHSDRGSQYASDHHQRVLAAAGIVCSMCRVG